MSYTCGVKLHKLTYTCGFYPEIKKVEFYFENFCFQKTQRRPAQTDYVGCITQVIYAFEKTIDIRADLLLQCRADGTLYSQQLLKTSRELLESWQRYFFNSDHNELSTEIKPLTTRVRFYSDVS